MRTLNRKYVHGCKSKAGSPALLLRRHRTDETMAVYSLAVTDLHTIIYLLCLVVFLLSKGISKLLRVEYK